MPKSNSKLKKFEFRGFVNVSFTDAEKDEFSSWVEQNKNSVEDAIIVLVEAGYKVGFSYDDYHGTNQVALTCKDLGSEYSGYCFTLKHSSPARAINILRWFYDTMLAPSHFKVESKNNAFDW